MAISFTSPVTGAAISGLTSPTYTLLTDGSPPEGVDRQWYVSALGGTQTGVDIHSIANPFTVSWKGPKSLVLPGQVDNTGVYRSPSRRNTYDLITRKGARPLVGQPARPNMVKTTFSLEAGTETADLIAFKAQLSLHIGMLNAIKDGVPDTVATGAA